MWNSGQFSWTEQNRQELFYLYWHVFHMKLVFALSTLKFLKL